MKKKSGLVTTVVFLVILGVVIVGLFLKLTDKDTSLNKDNATGRPEVEQLLLKDMENNYPQTAREVLKLYCRITRCMYNDDLTSEQTEQLVDMIRLLYADELLEINLRTNMISFVESEVAEFHKEKKSINSYTIDPASKIETYNDSQGERCVINMHFSIKNGNSFERSPEEFVIKLDDSGKWKILGWRKPE